MNEKIFHHAMSYVDDDIVENFLDNKSKRQAIAPSRFFLKWGAVAAVFCIAVATSFVMLWQSPGVHPTPTVPTTSSSTESSHTVTPESSVTPSSNQTPNSTKPNSTESNFTLPVPIDEIVWYEPSSVSGEAAWMEWNGMKLSNELYEAVLKTESDRYLAVTIIYDNDEYLNRFLYEGKSYAEHKEELESLRQLTYKYQALANQADMLKYGELLYTEGPPNGRKWTKEYYDKVVASFGKEFLSEFIVDGEFLAEKLEDAMEESQNKIKEKEKIIDPMLKAYHESSAPRIAEAFSQYAVTVKNGSAYLFITPAEFETIHVDNITDYFFSLASRAGYEGIVEEPDVPVFDNSVTGFDWNKIGFSSLQTTTNGQPRCDEDVIDMINETMDLWKYAYDYLEFEFYHNGELTEDNFENMQYQDISSYSSGIIVWVKYEDINLEALKELSHRSEITRIWIRAPLRPEPEAEK